MQPPNEASSSVCEQIPDTLELTDAARLAIHHMTSNVDPQLEYAPYFYMNMLGEPPCCVHESWDWGDVTARYVDALVSLRQMTGSSDGLHVEKKLKQLLLSTLDRQNGLSYRRELAWSRDEAGMFDQGRTLMALTSWYMDSAEAAVKEAAQRLIQGLWVTAVHARHPERGYAFCYYPYSAYLRGEWNATERAEPTCYGGGCTIFSLVRFYEVTGHAPALELAERLANFIVHESGVFKEDGDFRPSALYPEAGHFHSKTLSVLGILRLSVVTGRQEWIEWARRAYAYARTQGTSFGWFPEGLGVQAEENTAHSETCCTTDMIEIALLLARSGYPEYYNDVERFTRNYLMESQITEVGWMEESQTGKKEDTAREHFSDAPQKMLGGYVGRALPHDLVADGFLMGCCCGAGARAVYQVWDQAVECSEGKLTVNLLMNRRSAAGDVESYLPCEGRVVVKNRAASAVALRKPDGVDAAQVRVERSGSCGGRESAGFELNGQYLEVQGTQPGEEISFSWPVEEVQKPESLLKWHFNVCWRGDTVVELTPKGTKRPLYQRERMRSSEAGLRPKPSEPGRETTVHW